MPRPMTPMLRGRDVAAVVEREADAGVVGVVGGGSAREAGGEELGAVLDGAVEEHALGSRRGGRCGLLHAEGAVEVADFEDGLACVGGVQHDGEEEEQSGCGGPEEHVAASRRPR